MRLHEIKPKHPLKKPARIGRGGKRGKTSGRGMKGQKSRAGNKIRPEIRDMIKKLPKRRGFGKNRARGVNSSVVKPTVVNVGRIEEIYKAGETVTPETLYEKGLIRRRGGKLPVVKILGYGQLTKKVSFSGVVFSESAKEKVGTVS